MCENGIDTRGDCLQSRGAGSAVALVPGSADELYGLTDRGPTGGPPITLKPKMLPNGTQDTGEFLFVDTTRLPARTQTATVSITVG